MPRRLVILLALVALLPADLRAAGARSALRFEVSLADGMSKESVSGRLLVILGRNARREPRFAVRAGSMARSPVLGVDVKGLAPGGKVVVDDSALCFPMDRLADVKPGRYRVQALLLRNRDLRRLDAAGNLFGRPVRATIDPAKGGTVRLTLDEAVPEEELPAETEYLRYIKVRSALLSKFHGRDIYLRAGVILPRGYHEDGEAKYPLRIHIGGFSGRFTQVRRFMRRRSSFRKTWLADDTPRMLFLHLDGAGPLGDPYQVNSANNGPYGDAVVRELIPYVEKKFRAVGKPHARFLDGGSTGGWVSLALQVFYPDSFNGAWSHAPDPVDFRAFELIDVYRDGNAYVNARGFERPAARRTDGDVAWTVRHEVLLERVLSPGDNWTLSGRDWASWNAVFGPRGRDGLPRPLWDGATGAIDRDVGREWEKYDLRKILARDWKTLGPKLQGKLHVWAGEADEYFLNNAVHHLDDFLRTARPAFGGRITFGARQGHSWEGLSEAEMMKEMSARAGRGR